MVSIQEQVIWCFKKGLKNVNFNQRGMLNDISVKGQIKWYLNKWSCLIVFSYIVFNNYLIIIIIQRLDYCVFHHFYLHLGGWMFND